MFPAPGKKCARFVNCLAFEVIRTHLAHGDVEKVSFWAVRWAEPVSSSLQTRVNEGALRAGLTVRQNHRTAAVIETFGPGLLGVLCSEEELACAAVQQVIESVSVSHGH